MAKSLVHIDTGPATPTGATLGRGVAAAAAKAGHDLTVYRQRRSTPLSAGVYRGRAGLVTGTRKAHPAAMEAASGRFILSGMPS